MADKNEPYPQTGLYPQLPMYQGPEPQMPMPQGPMPQMPMPQGPMPQTFMTQGTVSQAHILPNSNMSVPVGPNSSRMTCPSCHAQISTRCEKTSTIKTHLVALILCLFLCWPCVCLPYCMDSCRATQHFCPSCGAFLGTYDR